MKILYLFTICYGVHGQTSGGGGNQPAPAGSGAAGGLGGLDANALAGVVQGLAPLISVVPGILQGILSQRLNRPR